MAMKTANRRIFTVLQYIVLAPLFVYPLSGQAVERTVATGKLLQGQTVLSVPIVASAGEQINVRAGSDDPQFGFESAIYIDENLVAKEDPEQIASESFQWIVPNAGTYRVQLRNLSEVDGTFVVSLSRPKNLPEREDKPYTDVRIFYATNRKAVADSPFFAAQADPGAPHYGKVLISMPRDHRIGYVEGPAIRRLLRHDQHVEILGKPTELNATGFFKDLQNVKKEVLVYIHGFNTKFPEAVRRAAQLKYDLGFDGEVIAFTWPSQGELGIRAYDADREQAMNASKVLGRFLSTVAANSGLRRVHILAHSMGNLVLTRALDSMTESDRSAARLGEILFMAPDVDSSEFRTFVRRFEHVGPTGPKLTLYASDRDLAFVASALIWKGRQRAGEAGANIIVEPERLITVDASRVDTSLLGAHHQYYGDNSTVLADVYLALRGVKVKDRYLETIKPGWYRLPSGCR